MTKPQKPWRRLIPDRLVNRFATRNVCQAGYELGRRRRPKKSTPIDKPWRCPICGAGVDKTQFEIDSDCCGATFLLALRLNEGAEQD
jgi:hypothetical protein